MDQLSSLDQLTKTTRRWDFDDGLTDFRIGVIFFACSLFLGVFFSPAALQWMVASLKYNQSTLLLTLVLILLSFTLVFIGTRWGIVKIRKNPRWRNRGFVQPLRLQVNWQTNAAAGFVFIAVIALANLLLRGNLIAEAAFLRAVVSATGVASGIVLVGLGRSIGFKRFLWVGTLGATFSALLAVIPTDFSTSWLLLGAGWMILLSLSGLLAFRQFVAASKG